MWLCFLLHKFKMMTSPDVFFIFSKFWFSGLLGERGVTGQKMAQNDKKFCLTPYLRNCTSYECFLLHMCKMVSPAIFFIFSKVWFFRFFRVHQWITKGNSEVCPTFFTCVWFYFVTSCLVMTVQSCMEWIPIRKIPEIMK